MVDISVLVAHFVAVSVTMVVVVVVDGAGKWRSLSQKVRPIGPRVLRTL